MQTLLEMWKASPWAFAIGMVVIAYAVTDTIDKAIRNLTRRSVRFTAEDLDLLAEALADRLGEQPAKIDDAILDHLALKIADRMGELQADAAADDDMVAKLADAVRDRVNTVGLLACDIELIAARVMDLADERRAEREKAKVAKTAAKPDRAEVLELPKFGVGDTVVDDNGDQGVISHRSDARDNAWYINWTTGEFAGDTLWSYEESLKLVSKASAKPATT